VPAATKSPVHNPNIVDRAHGGRFLRNAARNARIIEGEHPVRKTGG
jgi:hypothetical protein